MRRFVVDDERRLAVLVVDAVQHRPECPDAHSHHEQLRTEARYRRRQGQETPHGMSVSGRRQVVKVGSAESLSAARTRLGHPRVSARLYVLANLRR